MPGAAAGQLAGRPNTSEPVGLQLRPRKAAEAAALWASLYAEGGAQAREALWSTLPRAADLDDGAAFLARREAEAADAEIDAALEELLGRED